MLRGLGDADREFTHAILGPPPEERQVYKVRMTTSHMEESRPILRAYRFIWRKKGSNQGEVFWMASSPKKTYDMSSL